MGERGDSVARRSDQKPGSDLNFAVLAREASIALGSSWAFAVASGVVLAWAIEGLIKEGEEVLEKAKDTAVCDAGMIAAGQAIEHYEIARYGTLVAWAEQLGLTEAGRLLGENLAQEKRADKTLNEIALRKVNRKAA
jgi:ferritin-like metal-binding protein YciE